MGSACPDALGESMRRTFVVAICVVVLVLSLVACSQPVAESSDRDAGSETGKTEIVQEPAPVEPPVAQPVEQPAPTPTGQAEEPRVAPHIALYRVDDTGANYALEYGDEVLDVYYEPDVWSVHGSYRVTDHDDLVTICQLLIEEHPIHGRDYESYRTAVDMAYEWQQHNYAYQLLPEDSPWLESVSNVDLDPEDQGKSLRELYRARVEDDQSLLYAN